MTPQEINIKVGYGSNEVTPVDWSPSNIGKMIIHTNAAKNNGGEMRSAEDIMWTAAHEFGHFLGMGDAYVEAGINEKGERKTDPLPGFAETLMGERYMDLTLTDLKILYLARHTGQWVNLHGFVEKPEENNKIIGILNSTYEGYGGWKLR